MANNRTVKVGHTKEREAHCNGVFAARYRFDKLRVTTERDGSVAEVPFSETLYLLRLPGSGDRKLWLRPWERQRVLEALAEVEPFQPERQTTLPAVAEATIKGEVA
jgi:hypothetical protein